MSYGGLVNCRCYQDGKTVKPPYEEYVVLDNYGISFNNPYPNDDEKWDDFYQKDDAFENWKATACPHEDMEYCYEILSNSSGMSSFRNFVNQFPDFPTIQNILPELNGGYMPAYLAKKLVEELILLENQINFENKIFLVQQNNNAIKASCNENEFSIFAFFDKIYKYGIDANGFFILRTETENNQDVHYEMFRSNYFSIRKSNFNASVVVVDEKKARRFRGGITLTNPEEDAECVYFTVEKKQVKTNQYYDYIIAPLKKLAQASMETGNPIYWT